MLLHPNFRPAFRAFSFLLLLVATLIPSSRAQEASQKPSEKPTAPAEPQNPAQFDLLETKFRFEANGDSRKEVHALVHINSELGVRQFARLNFDYNRSFQSVEIPLAHITHPTGGTSDILPSAITDNPNPAVVNAPAFQDVRVKSVRILGLAPGDTLEYRVVTTTTHHPLAPDFWLDHTFDRTGVVSQENFELDAPTPRLRIRINPDIPATTTDSSGEGDSDRVLYRWHLESSSPKLPASRNAPLPDIALTTYSSWSQLRGKLSRMEASVFTTHLWLEAMTKMGAPREPVPPRALYYFVSSKIATIDVPIDLARYVRRSASQILESGYGTEEEKARLLAILILQNSVQARVIMYGRGGPLDQELPRPSLLSGTLLTFPEKKSRLFLDPGLEVAPFGLIPADLRGRRALIVVDSTADNDDCFVEIPRDLPFPSTQKVTIAATIGPSGELKATVKYIMRGDNELLLRVAFHQSPKEKWKDLAQLLSLTDGFRGKVTSVTASDPYATREPFTVEYEIEQPKFVDWSKKPIRIPALLPQLGLPDPPAKAVPGAATSPIELGTPLEVQTSMTLHLPPDTDALAPTGTSVQRDYATFSSQYSIQGLTLTASRHINFLLRQVPADRAPDYNAFLRAVLSDQAQTFTLERQSSASPAAKP